MKQILTILLTVLMLNVNAQSDSGMNGEMISGFSLITTGAIMHSSNLFKGNSSDLVMTKVTDRWGIILGLSGCALFTYGIFKNGRIKASGNSLKLVVKF